MVLITLFVLFVATWIALFLAKQISTPISALLEAAGEVRRGNLQHRVTVRAVDELAPLVRGFNADDRGAGSQQPANWTGGGASPKPSWRASRRA